MLGITNIFLGQKLNNCKKDQKQPPVVKFYHRNTILTLSVTSWSPPASSEQPHESGLFFLKNLIFQTDLFDKIFTFVACIQLYYVICTFSRCGSASQSSTMPVFFKFELYAHRPRTLRCFPVLFSSAARPSNILRTYQPNLEILPYMVQ